MTIEEIALSLPNGFHDSHITGVRINYAQRTAEMEMMILVSGPDDEDTEKYQPATLTISELLYFVIEPPASPYTSRDAESLVDGGSSELKQSVSQLPKPLPAGAFTYWFFVNNWNAFIHIAAMNAEIVVH